jgi:pilus assembly protein CpaB
MRNKRFLIVLTGAVVFGLLAAVSVSRYLSSAQAYTKNLNTVVVAKVNIPLGKKIIAEEVTVAQFPRESMPDGVFESADKLVGRVAVVNIKAREPITDSKLAAEGTAGGLSAVIPEGYRAMTVKVDDVVGISGFIMPGAMVDVVVVIDPTENSGNQNPISKIVLQNIKVLANGQNIDQPKDERETNSVKAG